MSDLTAVINHAIEGLSDTSADPGGSDESTSSPETPVVAAEDVAAETDTEGQPPATGADDGSGRSTTETTKAAEVDEIAKLLEVEGFKPPEKGQKENRMPYSRVKKITENAVKKTKETFAGQLSERDTRLAEVTTQLENMQRGHELAETDPDRYVAALAALNPAYKKFLGRNETTTEERRPAAAAAVVSEKAPGPDGKLEDGSPAYTNDGLMALLEWHGSKVEERAASRLRKEYDERLRPIEQEREASETIKAREPLIRRQIDAIHKTWGADLVKKHEADISKVLNENLDAHNRSLKANKLNKNVPIEPMISIAEAAARVLVPKTRADRDTMRAELLKEINTRPAGAAPGAPAASTASAADPNEPRSLEDIIKEAIAPLKR